MSGVGARPAAAPSATPAWSSALDRVTVDAPGRSPQDVLLGVTVARNVVEDFRPLTRSLGWQLSDLFWTTAGVSPFVENEVPFVVTSNGRLSEDAAAVLLANCTEAPTPGPILVLELGAGTGLFARYFLDAFRALCAQAGTDAYDRLVYLVSDRSARTVEQWAELRLFEDHGAHAVLGVCDALSPGDFRPLGGTAVPAAPLRAVFCNYSLDVLPASIVRRGATGCEELAVRTSLANDAGLLRQYTRLTPSEIGALAASDDPSKRSALIPLLSVLQLEAAFVPVNGSAPPHAEEALSVAPPEAARTVVNHGAIECLRSCLDLLDPAGFVLLSDYGPVRAEQVAENAAAQRFGRTTALGINFPFLDHYFAARGHTVLRPEGDEDWPIHARLLSRRALPRTADAFRGRFAIEAYRAREGPADEARAHRAAGRNDPALEAYRTALGRRPRDWYLLGEVAEFVGLFLRDFSSGVELARMAVAINPWYSSWLWNVLGDCLFCLERYEAAHEAYLQAHRISPRDARTNLNLAYTLFESGAYAEALSAVAAGLAADPAGQYRETLLQKQQQILGAISARSLAERERLARGIPVPA